jgi:hypothetical protein
MGTLYTVIPLDKKCADWLDAEGVLHPPVSDLSRYPTPREISAVLSQLSGYTVTIHSDPQTREWTAQIEGPGDSWAQIRVREFSSDETPHEFFFSKGWPEIVFTVTEQLTQYCGALVIVDDSSSRPVIVASGTDTRQS